MTQPVNITNADGSVFGIVCFSLVRQSEAGLASKLTVLALSDDLMLSCPPAELPCVIQHFIYFANTRKSKWIIAHC